MKGMALNKFFKLDCFAALAMTLWMSLFVAIAPAFAAVAIETSVSRSILPIGEQLTLDIIISNADGNIDPPKISSIEGFTSYSQGRSQEFTIVNGNSSSRSIYSYVLVANSTGHKTIGPFEIMIAGKEYKVAPVKVEVTQGGAPTSGYTWARSPVTAPSPRALPATTQLGDQDIFVKAWLDKDEVSVNEPVMLTYTLFTRLSATYKGFEKEPVTTGFWVEDFPPDKTVRRTEQFLNGQRYVVADVRKIALFPTQAGVFTVDPGTLSATVEVRSEDNFDTFFSGNIFGSRRVGFPNTFVTQVVSKLMPADPVKVVVKALPTENRPVSFNGAVGQYEISSSLDKSEVEAGNPVTFRVRISGKGNINTLQSPSLPKSSDFKIYDSSSSSNISKERLVVEGEKVTETVIVPRKPGTYTIPSVAFTFFDPKKGEYVERHTESHRLNVTPGTEPEAPAASESTGVLTVDKEDVGLAAKDIRFIKTVDDGAVLPETPLYRNRLYWLINLALVLAGLLAAFLSARKDSDAKDLRSFRNRRSHALARGKLQAAAQTLKQGKPDAFYEEVSKAVHGYFADKLNVPAQAVSRDGIEERTGKDLSPELLNKISALFEELSRGRFGRAQTSHEEMKNLYDLADEVITKFEKVRRK